MQPRSRSALTGWSVGIVSTMLIGYAVASMLVVSVFGGATQQAQAVTPPSAPAGTIMAFAGTTVPDGWLALDGAAFNPTDYPELHALFPSDTLPDLRGQFLRGWSTTTAQDPGGPRAPMSTQSGMFASHTHNVGITYSQAWVQGSAPAMAGFRDTTSTQITTTYTSAAAGGSETRPKNVAVMWIISAVTPAAGLTQAQVDARIAAAIAAIPTPTPTPTATSATPTDTATPTGAPSDTGSATPVSSATPS